MSNQDTGSKQDRNGGGDVTKAEKVSVESTDPTIWDSMNNHGKGRFDPREDS